MNSRTAVSVASGCVAFTLNSLLSFIIYATKMNTLGKYRKLLLLYTLSAAIYALNQIFTAAEFVVCPSGYLLYDTLNVLPYPLALAMIENYAVCFLVMITIISWCFVYRYYVAFHTSALEYLHRRWKLLSFGTVSVLSGVLFCSLYSCFPREDYYQENRDAFSQLTGRSLNLTAYNCGPVSVKGEVNWQVFWGLGQFTGYILVCGLVNLYCSVNIARFLRKSFTESSTILKKQMRIFILLMLQFLFPLTFNMIPVFLTFLAAYFHLPTFGYEAFVGPIVSFAQIIDPILIFVFISDYRKTVRNFFPRAKVYADVSITLTVFQ